MSGRAAVLAGICCLLLSGPPLRAQEFRQNSTPGTGQPPAMHIRVERVPAYHKHPPKGPLPVTLDPQLFPDPLNQHVYAMAAKEKTLLYQLPCYCGCDREAVHHKSLLDCYCDRHASFCATCKMEAVFAYQEYRKGKTAAQIRREIIAGKWRKVDLSSYAASASAK